MNPPSNFGPSPAPGPSSALGAILGSHQAEVNALTHSITTLLPPDDPELEAEIERALASYRACYQGLIEKITLLMPNP